MVEPSFQNTSPALSATCKGAPRYSQTCFWARWRLRLTLGGMLVMLIAACLWRVPSWAAWSFPTGAALSVAGIAMRVWAAGWLRKHEALATDGPYAIVRHPLYLGTGLIAVGQSLMCSVPIAVLIFPLFWLMLYRPAIREEEAFLIEKYGDEYRRFMTRTGALVPRLQSFQSGLKAERRCFSWSQAWRNREYEGVAMNLAALVAYGFLQHWR